MSSNVPECARMCSCFGLNGLRFKRQLLEAAQINFLFFHPVDGPPAQSYVRLKDPTSDLEIQSNNLPQSNLDGGKYYFESLEHNSLSFFATRVLSLIHI